MVATPVYQRVGMFVLALLFLVTFSTAAPHVDVYIEETVNQNVTFAADFDLIEERTFSLIEGVITVTNPGDETVFDIYVILDEVASLESDFINRGAVPLTQREGFQVIFPNVDGSVETINDTIGVASFDLELDLDEDGINDSVRVNNTHIIFNITSEHDQLVAIPFSNQTNTSLDISVPGTILNMTFDLVSTKEDTEHNDGWTFATVSIIGEVTTPGQLISPGEVNVTIQDLARPYAVLHIPELRSGQFTVYDYNVSSLLVAPPLDIDTAYTNPEFSTKVLSGEYFWVQLIARNIATVGDLENVNITMRAENVTVVNGSVSQTFDFTLHNLSTDSAISADNANVVNTSNKTWFWGVNGGTIPVGEEYNITFQIRAPDTINSSGTFLAMTQTLAYQINTTASQLNLLDVRARASVVFNETKRIIRPQDSLENRNVTWQSEPKVGTNENITFTLEKVSMWVTEVLDPNERVPGLNTTYFPDYTVNLTRTWLGAQWIFNFTDGSIASAPPPIVWMKPYWIIANVNDQIVNSSFTVNGTDIYMNYIYVVNGYWLEIEKRVIDAGDSMYHIRTEVRNRGNGHTPQNMTVTVYDFVQSNFEAWNFSPTPNADSPVTGQFDGIAYQWDAGLRTNISTSFAPREDADGLDWYYINYTVNGSGDFSPSDLYIVGLDPRAIDGANTFEGVSVVSAIASTSREMIYLAIVVFLIAINVANFMMTSRISRKLDRK